MNEFPRIRIELEGMKYQIIHAFASHNTEIEEIVEKELEKAIATFPYEETVARLSSEIIAKAIDESLKEFMIWGKGKKMLREIIDAKLTVLFGDEE